MTEKIESFSTRKLAESNGTVMTTQNILREARMLKNVIKDPKQQQSDVKEEDDLKEEKEEREMEEKEEQHRSFSRTGNDLIETDDELVEVRSIYLIVLITIYLIIVIVSMTIYCHHQNARKINAIQHHRSFTTKLFSTKCNFHKHLSLN